MADSAALLDSIAEFVLAITLHRNRLVRVNAAVIERTGYSAQLLLDCHLVDLIPADDRPALIRALGRVRDGAVAVATIATHLPRKRGGTIAVTGTARLVQLPSQPAPVFVLELRETGKGSGGGGSGNGRTSVSDRDRAEALMEHLHDGVIECDLLNGRHIYANSRFCEFVGLDRDQVLNATWPGPWWEPSSARQITRFRDALAARSHLGGPASDAQADTHADTLADNEEPCLDLEQHLVRSDGQRIPVRVHVSLVDQADSTLVVALIHDLTDEMQRAAEIENAPSIIAIASDRERIARDLHDNAIQRLFATGLHLQTALLRDEIGPRVTEAIEEIDEIIREIRTSIFSLQVPRTLLEGLEQALRSTAAEGARLLGFQPQLTTIGDLDGVPSELAHELLSVTRELLTNVAKHASANQVWATVEVTHTGLTLTLEDDGVGYRTEAGRAGRGVSNVLARAEARGGTAEIGGRQPSGTIARWWVPLRGQGTALGAMPFDIEPWPAFDSDSGRTEVPE